VNPRRMVLVLAAYGAATVAVGVVAVALGVLVADVASPDTGYRTVVRAAIVGVTAVAGGPWVARAVPRLLARVRFALPANELRDTDRRSGDTRGTTHPWYGAARGQHDHQG